MIFTLTIMKSILSHVLLFSFNLVIFNHQTCVLLSFKNSVMVKNRFLK